MVLLLRHARADPAAAEASGRWHEQRMHPQGRSAAKDRSIAPVASAAPPSKALLRRVGPMDQLK
ncbi:MULTISPECIES: hypothetical protein [Sphingopyxis]|jgi:hypothetical protein|uniref:hypothetical protein n=1 Tax=Sphingopyxis TaxID=165697 RepID=UPI000AD4C5D7|nr:MULTISPECIES: hypothetical protein [Sphingopyxis]